MKSFVYTLIQKCDHQNKKIRFHGMSLRPRLSCFRKTVSCFMYTEVKAIPLTLGPAGPGGPGDPWAPYGLKHAISLAGLVAYVQICTSVVGQLIGNVVGGRRTSGDPYLKKCNPYGQRNLAGMFRLCESLHAIHSSCINDFSWIHSK